MICSSQSANVRLQAPSHQSTRRVRVVPQTVIHSYSLIVVYIFCSVRGTGRNSEIVTIISAAVSKKLHIATRIYTHSHNSLANFPGPISNCPFLSALRQEGGTVWPALG